MSESMDFSDMFRRTEGDNAKPVISKQHATSTKHDPNGAQENMPPLNNAESDSLAYVKNTLRNMNHDLQTKDLTPAAVQAIEMLYSERCYWQNQSTMLSDESVKVRSSLSQAQRDKVRDGDVIDGLKKENQQWTARFTALTAEHREVKNHWLAEKNDLQTRIFQVQALNTQVSGTLKKSEKDFTKLQNQLAKIAKDGTKGMAKPAIMMSLPVRKNLSQESTQGCATTLLKDAEMQAAKKTISTLDAENHTLRGSMETLQRNLDELQESFESAVRLSETKTRQHLEGIITEHAMELESKESLVADLRQKLAAIQQEKDAQFTATNMDRTLPAIAESAPLVVVVDNAAVLPAPVVAAATPVRSSVRPPATPSGAVQDALRVEFMSPSQLRSTVKFRATAAGVATPGSIAKRYLEGTPGARPVQWVVEQANTEVKRLRERAEKVARGDAGAAAAVAATGTFGNNSTSHGESSGEDSGAASSALWRMKLNMMKLHLSEALAVIQEQDRLIHSALLGRPVGMDADMDLSALAVADHLLESPAAAAFGANEDEDGGAKKEVMDHLANFSTLKDSDFLPPASPETYELLKAYGWSCLPAKMSAIKASSPYTDAHTDGAPQATTLTGEFDAEN